LPADSETQMDIRSINDFDQIRCLEERLIDPEWRCRTEFLNSVIDDQFEEHNPNHGFDCVVSKQKALRWLAQPEEQVTWSITQFAVKMASDDVAMARYLSQKTKLIGDRTIIKYHSRLSVWKKNQSDPDIPWKLFFHQSLSLNAPDG